MPNRVLPAAGPAHIHFLRKVLMNSMIQTTIRVSGMQCSMCESHINEAVRKAFPSVKKVTSSHTRGETVILSEEELPAQALQKAINDSGYEAGAVTAAPYKKKGLFSIFHK